jgi:hypothetical protein
MNAIVETLRKSAKGAKFVSLTYTAKGSGEVAKHVIIHGASMEKLYTRDVAVLERAVRLLDRIGSGDALTAARAMLASKRESLAVGIGKNSAYTAADVYEQIAPGIKVHRETGDVHVMGLAHAKTVIVPGEYREVKSRNGVTAAKKRITKLLPSDRVRQFAVPNVSRVAANGDVLELA